MKHAITGLINSGKTTLAKKLSLVLNYQVIEIDDIRRFILWNSKDISHINLRKELGNAFDINTDTEYAWINRSLFTQEIFKSPEALFKYSLIATPVIKEFVAFKQSSDSLLVWVYILEECYSQMCDGKIIEVVNSVNNNNSLLIDSRRKIQLNSLFKRDRQADIIYQHTDSIESLLERLK